MNRPCYGNAILLVAWTSMIHGRGESEDPSTPATTGTNPVVTGFHPAGAGPELLYGTASMENFPRRSPDGSRPAFRSHRAGQFSVIVLDVPQKIR